jgi:hypothetical protein
MQDISSLLNEQRELERRADRLAGLAGAGVREYLAAREELAAIEAFLELSPKAAARLEDLTRELFGETLDEIEANLTHAVREILGQDRVVTSRREIKGGRLYIEFEMLNAGEPEHILVGQGGSVCNILSVGLRLVALSQLDPERHRRFLVLDEQDCWLKPELVPKFVDTIAKIADRLSLQALYISHHPMDLFAGKAKKIFGLKPSKTDGVSVEVILDRSGGGENAGGISKEPESPESPEEGRQDGFWD